MSVLIIGGGIGGLTTALFLHQAGIPCRVYEGAPELKALGVGINILPHAMRELARFGVPDEMLKFGIEPLDFCFFSRHGQLIYKEPAGRFAGYDVPHISIHRGDLHHVLMQKVQSRLGPDAVALGHRCVRIDQDAHGVTAYFEDAATGSPLPPVRGSSAIGCDGIRSCVRQQFFRDEGPPRFGGINMWRGVTRRAAFLDGRNVCRVGAIKTGKLVIYPIRNLPDGLQLINWVAEIEQASATENDWSTPGRLGDFMPLFASMKFDWLDIPEMLETADTILEYPMVDREPLPRWTFGRITLLGDAAHPVYPRGGNGAAQAILDANAIARHLQANTNPADALVAYEAERLPLTTKVVHASRIEPPDTIINRVEELSGGRPFKRIEDVIDPAELKAISGRYARTAGYDLDTMKRTN
ncbi:MAG: flavin-dependent oxidoreductase [Burkholderiales bacterium]